MIQLLSVNDTARVLAISPWTVRSILRKGKLSPTRIGRRCLVEMSEVEKFIRDCQASNPEGKRQHDVADGGVVNGNDVRND